MQLMNDFPEVYDRALAYKLVEVSRQELRKRVKAEDEKRFKQELEEISFLCPECGKQHCLNESDLERLFKNKALGKISFTSFCPNSEISLYMSLNARTNGFATPIHEIKGKNVEIKAKSLHKLVFESEDFRNLSVEQLNKIIAYHKNRKSSRSEAVVKKAIKQLQIWKLSKASKPQTETEETEEEKPGLASKISTGLKTIFK